MTLRGIAGPLETGRVALIRYISPGGAACVGSGLLVDGRRVLTADHVADGSGHRVECDTGTRAVVAVLRSGTAEVDLAVLTVGEPVAGLGRLGCARVDRGRVDQVKGCVAVGFPRWQKTGDQRRSAQVNGRVPTAEGLESTADAGLRAGLLTLVGNRIPGAPDIPTGMLSDQQANPWGGMSGAGVVAGNLVVGVVRSHNLAGGGQSLTITPLTAVDELPGGLGKQFWDELGIAGPGHLPALPEGANALPDPAPAGTAGALGSPARAVTQSAASATAPGDAPGGPPTVTTGNLSRAPERASARPRPGGGGQNPQRRRRRRLALAGVIGGFLAVFAATVFALTGGKPPIAHSPRQASAARATSPAVAASHAPTPVNPSPSVTTTIPVGSAPLWVAISPDGRRAYIVNAGSDTVSVIDTASNRVIATISVPGAGRVAITPDGRYAYVTACPDCDNAKGDVSMINTASNTVTATFAVGSGPFGVAISPDGRYAYVTDRSSDAVSVINTASNRVTATIPVGIFPTCVAVSPDGRYAYVTNATTNTVSVIDTATDTVTATIPAGSGAFSVAFAPDSRHAYVANLNAGTVSVIDTGSDTVTTALAVGAHPFAVAVSPDGRYAYVTDADSNTVSVIDTASNMVTATIPLVNPEGVAFTPDGRHGYITDRDANTVSVIDTGTG